MEMTRIMRIYNREMQEQFDEECEKMKKFKPPGLKRSFFHFYKGMTFSMP